jgi:hypothetical protein
VRRLGVAGRLLSSKADLGLYFILGVVCFMKEISLYFFRLRASFLRNSAIFLLEIFSVGRARISSHVISGMDLGIFEFGLVVKFSDLWLMICYYYPINN